MKFKFISLISFLFTSICLAGCLTTSSSKTFIPDLLVEERTGINLPQPLLVSVSDGRASRSKSKEVIAGIQQGLKMVYGDAVEISTSKPTGSDRSAIHIVLSELGAGEDMVLSNALQMGKIYQQAFQRAGSKWTSVISEISSNNKLLGSKASKNPGWLAVARLDVTLYDRGTIESGSFTIPLIKEIRENTIWGDMTGFHLSREVWRHMEPMLVYLFDKTLIILNSQAQEARG